MFLIIIIFLRITENKVINVMFDVSLFGWDRQDLKHRSTSFLYYWEKFNFGKIVIKKKNLNLDELSIHKRAQSWDSRSWKRSFSCFQDTISF